MVEAFLYSMTKKSFKLFWVLLVLPVVLGGCGGIGALYQILIDPLIPAPTIDAEHSFMDKRVLIWVEPVPGTEVNAQLRRQLTTKLEENLRAHEAAKDYVDYERTSQYRIAHPDYARFSLGEIGSYFDADEVLAVVIEKMQMRHEAGEGYYRVAMLGSVKVVAVGSDERVWPASQTQRGFSLEDQLTEGRGEFFEGQLLEKVSAQAAEIIGPWFYQHKGKK